MTEVACAAPSKQSLIPGEGETPRRWLWFPVAAVDPLSDHLSLYLDEAPGIIERKSVHEPMQTENSELLSARLRNSTFYYFLFIYFFFFLKVAQGEPRLLDHQIVGLAPQTRSFYVLRKSNSTESLRKEMP
ncbi:hypothetical protein RDI58_030082 [Solanum bulbocastanum]|uniref:Uncharacterized protein n=1 Tax=Solanum bulbocastanum TaxID=147425 RepID=A0AAN8SY39_SOLBU